MAITATGLFGSIHIADRDVWTEPAFASYGSCVECWALVLTQNVDKHYQAVHPGIKET
jgi:hypothetical protein